MKKSSFAMFFLLLSTTFVHAEGDSFVSGFHPMQIANYQNMPQSAVVRIRRGREDVAEISCFQNKVSKGESLAGAAWVAVNPFTNFDDPKAEKIRCPKKLTAEVITVGASDPVAVEQPIFLTYHRRYFSRNSVNKHSLRPDHVAGYLRFQFAGFEYNYQRYATDEDPSSGTFYIYYSWY